MASVLEVLNQLTAVNLKELHHLRSDGTRLWDQLVALCSHQSRSAAVPQRHETISAFFIVFDYAVENHLSCFVLDFVAEVCGDTRLTSNDPLEAQLLDGTFVHAWCQHALAGMEQRLHDGLQGELVLARYAGAEGQLTSDLGKSDVVVRALQALARIRGSAATAGMGVADGSAFRDGGVAQGLSRAVCLHRCQSLVRWCRDQGSLIPGVSGLDGAQPAALLGPYTSLSEWGARVKARRDMRPAGLPRATFLDAVLQALGLQRAYPFPTFTLALAAVAKAASGAYTVAPTPTQASASQAGEPLQQPASCWCMGSDDAPKEQPEEQPAAARGGQRAEAARWCCCLALVTYLLTDLGRLGHPDDEAHRQLQASFASALHVSPSQVAAWSSAALLDDAPVAAPWSSMPRRASSPHVRRACTLLLQHTPSHLHINLMQVLSALGCEDTALLLHRAQHRHAGGPAGGDGAAAAAIAEATWAVMELRLRCGLMAEALALARQAATQPHTAAARRSVCSTLLRGVLDWCAAPQVLCPTGGGGGGQAEGGTAAASVARPSATQEWAMQLLLELLCGEEEEAVLLGWLQDCVAAGRPTGALLPLPLAARGKVPEALGAYQRWASTAAAAVGAGRVPPLPAGVAAEVDAAVNCAAAGLPTPLRNLQVDPPQPPAATATAAALLSGLMLNLDAGVAAMRVAGAGPLPPALAASSLPAAPSALLELQLPLPGADGSGAQGRAPTGRLAVVAAPTGLSGLPAGGSTAWVSRLVAHAGGGAAGRLGEPGLSAGALFDGSAPPPPLTTTFLLRGSRGGGAAAGEEAAAGGTKAAGEGSSGGAARSLFALGAAAPWAAGGGEGPRGHGVAAETPQWKRARPNVWAV